jgi:hypothetical protein
MDRLRVLAFVGVALLLAVAACGSGGGKKAGSRVPGRVRVVHVSLPASGALGRCLASASLRGRRAVVVERLGRVTRSLTIVERGRPEIFACDKTGVRFEGREWCGFSSGRLRDGRVNDPRLDILCVDRRGRHVASAFVNPVRGARWIGVDQGSYTELYPTAAGLPVRISSTRGVDFPRARATFRITQLGADGRVLAQARLTAQVAG